MRVGLSAGLDPEDEKERAQVERYKNNIFNLVIDYHELSVHDKITELRYTLMCDSIAAHLSFAQNTYVTSFSVGEFLFTLCVIVNFFFIL